jgi:hypothetical protein
MRDRHRPDGETGYVTNGNTPLAIAITPDGNTAYVVNGRSGTVTPIDLANGTPGAPSLSEPTRSRSPLPRNPAQARGYADSAAGWLRVRVIKLWDQHKSNTGPAIRKIVTEATRTKRHSMVHGGTTAKMALQAPDKPLCR